MRLQTVKKQAQGVQVFVPIRLMEMALNLYRNVRESLRITAELGGT